MVAHTVLQAQYFVETCETRGSRTALKADSNRARGQQAALLSLQRRQNTSAAQVRRALEPKNKTGKLVRNCGC